MKLSNHGSVPVYTISGSSTGRPLPEWLVRRRQRSLKHDTEFANRIELLQDFEFEEASSCIQISSDGDWIVSTGIYKPQIHVHYLPHLSLSYAHHTIAETRRLLLLSTDYSKQLLLQNDRSLEFHTPHGKHYSVRIPRYGRDLLYNRRNAEALIPSAGINATGKGEVFRLNLEVGRFMKPYYIDVGTHSADGLQGGIGSGSVNAGAIAEESHNLHAFGTSLGTVELWDSRSKSRAGLLITSRRSSDLLSAHEPVQAAVTALSFNDSGLLLATGSSMGLTQLYDLRSPSPLLQKDQGYGYPIHTLTFLNSPGDGYPKSHKIMSADKRIIKIWDTTTGDPWTHVEAAVDLHDVAWCKGSGMLLTANEGRQQHSFFVPALGPAPRWCSFLDNLVEEMAEDADDPNAFNGTEHRTGEVYDNFRFVTSKQLAALGLEEKIGTTLLKPYMHGYFIRQELYEEARVLAQPEIWAERRQQSIREKIEKERASRIRGSKRDSPAAAKVNKRLAEKLIERERKNEERKSRRAAKASKPVAEATAPDIQHREHETVLTDQRFASLFDDEDFAIDEASREYRALNPSTLTDTPGDLVQLTAAELEEIEMSRPRRLSSSDSDSNSEATDVKPSAGHRQRNGAEQAPATRQISTASYRKSGHSSLPPSSDVRLKSSRSANVNDRSSSITSGYSKGKAMSLGARARLAQPNRSLPLTNRSAAGRGEQQISFKTVLPATNKDNGRELRRGASIDPHAKRSRRSASGNVLRQT